tara:strand:+ start:549 stop:1028 length:480 start_codon:yes stop_codon:yes gene_type:complete
VSRSIRYRSGAPGIEALSISSTVELTVLLSGTTKKMLSSFELLIQYQPNRRCMRKKNRYKLDRKDSDNAKGVVTEITVSYDIDADKINSVISMRQDVDSGELMLRIGQQVQKCMTTVMPSFKEHMNRVDRLASMGADIGVIDLDEEFFNAEEYFDAKDS